MEIIKITERETELLEALVLIWEDSVRQTHTFLEEADIEALRPLVRQGLEFIPELWVLKAVDNVYKGFMGIDGKKLEMLFIESSVRGQGGQYRGRAVRFRNAGLRDGEGGKAFVQTWK